MIPRCHFAVQELLGSSACVWPTNRNVSYLWDFFFLHWPIFPSAGQGEVRFLKIFWGSPKEDLWIWKVMRMQLMAGGRGECNLGQTRFYGACQGPKAMQLAGCSQSKVWGAAVRLPETHIAIWLNSWSGDVIGYSSEERGLLGDWVRLVVERCLSHNIFEDIGKQFLFPG